MFGKIFLSVNKLLPSLPVLPSTDHANVKNTWPTAATHLFIPPQAAIWKGNSIKPPCYVTPGLQGGILPCASYLQLLPYRFKLIYLLYLQEADTHTEKVLLLPGKYLPVILWSSLPFLLPLGTRVHLLSTTLFSRNSLIRLARAAYNTTTQEGISYKDTALLQS